MSAAGQLPSVTSPHIEKDHTTFSSNLVITLSASSNPGEYDFSIPEKRS